MHASKNEKTKYRTSALCLNDIANLLHYFSDGLDLYLRYDFGVLDFCDLPFEKSKYYLVEIYSLHKLHDLEK